MKIDSTNNEKTAEEKRDEVIAKILRANKEFVSNYTGEYEYDEVQIAKFKELMAYFSFLKKRGKCRSFTMTCDYQYGSMELRVLFGRRIELVGVDMDDFTEMLVMASYCSITGDKDGIAMDVGVNGVCAPKEKNYISLEELL